MLAVGSNHRNRSKQNRSRWQNPTPAEIRAAREVRGLSQTEAAAQVYATLRTWQHWESEIPAESRAMPPAIFELFLLKTGQLELREILAPPDPGKPAA
jgi:DNA-binding transcriptional regulator YiaG